jgi:hypothetical protein
LTRTNRQKLAGIALSAEAGFRSRKSITLPVDTPVEGFPPEISRRRSPSRSFRFATAELFSYRLGQPASCPNFAALKSVPRMTVTGSYPSSGASLPHPPPMAYDTRSRYGTTSVDSDLVAHRLKRLGYFCGKSVALREVVPELGHQPSHSLFERSFFLLDGLGSYVPTGA